MLAYRDFIPHQLSASSFFKEASYATFDEAVAEANRWVQANGIQVVSVETVILPNLWASGRPASDDAGTKVSGEMASTWHQFVRVWYQE